MNAIAGGIKFLHSAPYPSGNETRRQLFHLA